MTEYRDLYRATRAALELETMRGCAIVAAAHLDDVLGRLLQVRLAPLPRDQEKLYKGHGPLSGFASRIDIAFSVGLLQPSLWRSLHFLRKVRNEFAHGRSVLDFDSPRISQWLREFFDSEADYLDVVWELTMGADSTDSGAQRGATRENARRLVEHLGTRRAFELVVAHVTAALEYALDAGTVEHLPPMSPDRTY